MKKIVFLLAMGLAFCKAQNDTTFNWLIGKWEASTKDGKFFESWKIGSNGLEGNGGEIVKGDTVFKENLHLQKKKGHWCYIAEVGKQAAVEFPLKQVQNGMYKFENLKHDFPQWIIYDYVRKDRFKARVGGTMNGKYSEDLYELDRVK